MKSESPDARDTARQEATLAFVGALLRSSDPEDEGPALSRLVVAVGSELPRVFEELANVADRLNRMGRHIVPVITHFSPQGSSVPGGVAPAGGPTKASIARVERRSSDEQLEHIFDALPRISEVEHVAPGLRNGAAEAGIAVTKTPRRASRGNGLLYVLDRYGRSDDGLSLVLLTHALEAMEALGGQDPRRAAQWEISELMRRKWPVKQLGNGRYRYVGPPPKEDGEM